MSTVRITSGRTPDLVKLLAKNGPRFLVIGSTAMKFHVPERPHLPNDLDLVVEPTPDTLQKLNTALTWVGAERIQAMPDDFARPGLIVRSEKSACNVDFFPPFPGFDFNAHWENAVKAEMEFFSTCILIASIDTMKCWLRHAQEMETVTSKRTKIADDLALLEGAAK